MSVKKNNSTILNIFEEIYVLRKLLNGRYNHENKVSDNELHFWPFFGHARWLFGLEPGHE
jgi:hypothetical protein